MVFTERNELADVLTERFDRAVWLQSEPARQNALFQIRKHDAAAKENRRLTAEGKSLRRMLWVATAYGAAVTLILAAKLVLR